MTTLREAAQMALQALQESKPIDIDDPTAFYRSAHAIEALRVALANEFNPDWDAMAVMVEEQQRMAKRIEELESALAQPEQEIESDRPHAEDDGCPTEKAVLQRFWREHQKQEPVRLQCVTCGAIYADGVPPQVVQPEQEPVAWFMEGTFEDGTPSFTQVCETDPEFYVPLYTAPPQREWQGLTDEDIRKLSDDCAGVRDENEFIRAIEAKLKEKNNG